jgi:hypothetical protein
LQGCGPARSQEAQEGQAHQDRTALGHQVEIQGQEMSNVVVLADYRAKRSSHDGVRDVMAEARQIQAELIEILAGRCDAAMDRLAQIPCDSE